MNSHGFSFVTSTINGNEIRMGSIMTSNVGEDITGETASQYFGLLESLFLLPITPEDIISSIERDILNQTYEDDLALNDFKGVSQYVIDTTLGKSKCYNPGMWGIPNSSDPDICSVCLEQFEISKDEPETEPETEPEPETKIKRFYVRELDCCKKHFHKRCIDKWFRKSSFSCPCCRNNFETNKNEQMND